MATVTVMGRAAVRVPPDEAHLSLTVEATRPTAAEALEDVSGRARRLVELCDELGIEAERRVTSGATVVEHVEHDREGRRQHRGRDRAAAYAEALGGRLGAITAVREPGTSRPPAPEPRAMRMAAAESFDAAPVEAGQLELAAAVEVEFALERG